MLLKLKTRSICQSSRKRNGFISFSAVDSRLSRGWLISKQRNMRMTLMHDHESDPRMLWCYELDWSTRVSVR